MEELEISFRKICQIQHEKGGSGQLVLDLVFAAVGNTLTQTFGAVERAQRRAENEPTKTDNKEGIENGDGVEAIGTGLNRASSELINFQSEIARQEAAVERLEAQREKLRSTFLASKEQ